MKKSKIRFNAVLAILLLTVIWSLGGCGKKENDYSISESLEGARESEGLEESEETEGLEELDELGEDESAGASEAVKVNFEGNDSAELNGKIESMIMADTSFIVVHTTDDDLFLLSPCLEYELEDSRMKSYKIAEDSRMHELVYANQNIAYGKNHFPLNG